jgi:hypothetical protein
MPSASLANLSSLFGTSRSGSGRRGSSKGAKHVTDCSPPTLPTQFCSSQSICGVALFRPLAEKCTATSQTR